MSYTNKNDRLTGGGIGNPVKSMNSREAQTVSTSENPGTSSGFLPWIQMPHFGLPTPAYVVSISHLDIFTVFTAFPEQIFLFISH